MRRWARSAMSGWTLDLPEKDSILCIFQLELHHLMELLVVLGKGPGDGQKEDHRRKDYQDHGHPVEHQFSLHAHALLFGKRVQRPQLPEFVQHGVSSSLLVIAP